jgi:hypothetical protein
VSEERPREGTPVERLQDGRLHLDEPLLVEVGPHRADDPRAVHEQPSRLLAGHQVELAPAVAGLHVAETGVLVGRRAQRLGEDRKAVYPQRDLAAPGAQRRPLDADDVPQIQ